MFKVEVEAAEFVQYMGQMAKALDAACYTAWVRQTDKAAEYMRANGYKDRTGALSKSMRGVASRQGAFQYRAVVSANERYALWVDQPTRAHIIKPKRRGYPLRFFWAKVGRYVSFMRVRHPGTRGAHFSRAALLEFGMFRFPEFLQHACDETIEYH